MPPTSPSDPINDFGKFIGTVVTEWVTPDRDMRLLVDFTYVDNANVSWVAGSGARINGASIPRVLWSVVGSPFTGSYRNASVVHDVACDERTRSWVAAHRMFYQACRCGGVGELKAKLMFAAVYHFGPRWGPGSESVSMVPESRAALAELRAFVADNPSLADIERHRPQSHARVQSRGPGGRSTRSTDSYLRALKPKKGLEALEAAGDSAGITRRSIENLKVPEVRLANIQRLQQRFEKADHLAGHVDEHTASLRRDVMQHLDPALAKLGTEGTTANLVPNERFALEALIELNDRPSLVVQGGDIVVDLRDPDVDDWQGPILLARSRMQTTITSVGRIDLDGEHVGTGFVVAPGIVMTNRHVLEALAAERRVDGMSTWSYEGTPTIDFLKELGSTEQKRFGIKEVLFAGPIPIQDVVDPVKLDLVLLKVEGTDATGAALPPPLKLASRPAATMPRGKIYTVGYPAEPTRLPLDGTARDAELAESLERIFRLQYGVKRLALGYVTRGTGTLAGDTSNWLLGHDATTLGGNSGSCVVALGAENVVIGLHFAGHFFEYNMAHVLANVPQLRGPGAPALLNWD